MYEYLEGVVARRGAARLILDVGGVGYDLAVPPTARFGAEEGQRLRVWVHLIVREDQHALYGFPERADRDIFRLLLRVRGIGPAMALGVLSGVTREELLDAVVREDTAALKRVKGVGQRTADQILLDLRDKAAALLGGDGELTISDGPGRPRGEAAANVEDAVAALLSIGFAEKDARKRVELAGVEVGTADLERLVRAAIAP